MWTGLRREDAGGRSILRMNLRTFGSENCCSRRGRSSLRTASLRWRAVAASETRSSRGRGECSSSPYPLSTSVHRNCARSPSTRDASRVLLALPLEVVQPHCPTRLDVDQRSDASGVPVLLPFEHLPSEAEEPPFGEAFELGFERDDHAQPPSR